MYEIQKRLKQLGYNQGMPEVPIDMRDIFLLDGLSFEIYMWLFIVTEHTMGVLDWSVFEELKLQGREYWEEEFEYFLEELSECEKDLDAFFEYIELEDRYVFLPVYRFFVAKQLELLL